MHDNISDVTEKQGEYWDNLCDELRPVCIVGAIHGENHLDGREMQQHVDGIG